MSLPDMPDWIRSLISRFMDVERGQAKLERRMDDMERRVSDLEASPDGFFSWLFQTTSNPRQVIAVASLALLAVVLLIILAAYEVEIPFLTLQVAPLGISHSLLVRLRSDYVH